jgi:uncharacterized protein (DUF58 family)
LILLRIFRNTYFQARWFLAALCLSAWFGISFAFPPLLVVGYGLTAVFVLLTIIDIILLNKTISPLTAQRSMAKMLSLGDENNIKLTLVSETNIDLNISIIEELPLQLQERNFTINCVLKKQDRQILNYIVRPLERGKYQFGATIALCSSKLGLIQRRIELPTNIDMAVYPSIIQMKKFEIRNLDKTAFYYGVKKKRRIGQSYEFEQINNYVPGDDFRHINWKATGKLNTLMVNHYVEEKSQQIYCIIDKSRNMMLPFNGLNLLDYAINASLVLSNVALGKSDKAGLITFSQQVDSYVKAINRPGQLNRILETLYNEQSNFKESNYEYLYHHLRYSLGGRSLIFLFTNFESRYNMERNLSVLRKLAKQHLLVIIFFENTEISEFAAQPAKTVEDIYTRTIAKKFSIEKFKIAQELQKHGIISIYTRPEELTINAINKYLEIKSRGLL